MTFLREHPSLLIGAVSAAFVATRLLAVSGYSHHTALAVLANQGTANVLLGSLLPLFLTTPLGMFLFATAMVLKRYFDGHSEATRKWLIAFTALGVWSAVITPWPFLLPMPLFAVAILKKVAIPLMRGRQTPPVTKRGRVDKLLFGMITATLAATPIIYSVASRPWLPSEAVAIGSSTTRHTTSGDVIREPPPVLVGYVLKEAGDDLIILTDAPRGVSRVAADSITSRQYCRVPETGDGIDRADWMSKQPSLLMALGAETVEYPRCQEGMRGK